MTRKELEDMVNRQSAQISDLLRLVRELRAELEMARFRQNVPMTPVAPVPVWPWERQTTAPITWDIGKVTCLSVPA